MSGISFEEYGWDEASGREYCVSVVKAEADAAQEANPLNCLGLLVRFRYHLFKEDNDITLSSLYDIQFFGHIWRRHHKEDLGPMIDLGGIPLAARNDVIRLLFSLYEPAEPEPIQAHLQVYVHDYVPPNHEVDIDKGIFLGLDEGEFERARLMPEPDFSGHKPASRKAVRALEKVYADTTCAVCLNEFQFDNPAVRMPCSHVFHARCILEWFERRNSCPMCRFELPSAS